MDPRIRYCVELEKIRNLPDFLRVRAEVHFFLLKEYLDVFLKHQADVQGKDRSVHKATKSYCAIKKVPQRTFYNWLRAYKEKGIEGLVPRYGHTRKVSSKSKRKGKRGRFTISITLDIVAGKSPSSLMELGKIIAASPLIAPELRASFTAAFRRLCELASQRTPLKLQSSLTKEEKHRLELLSGPPSQDKKWRGLRW